MNPYETMVTARMRQIGAANGKPGSTLPCLQIESEMAWLAPFIDKLQPKTILEIGFYKGGWHYVLSPWYAEGAHIIGIDAMSRHRQDDGRAEMEAMIARLEGKGFRVDMIEGRSDSHAVIYEVRALCAIAPGTPHKRFDLLHVDGGHSYDAARYDWGVYKNMVRKGGLVVLHDIGTRTSQMDVKRVWEEIKEAGYTTHEFYEKNGIGVVEMQ